MEDLVQQLNRPKNTISKIRKYCILYNIKPKKNILRAVRDTAKNHIKNGGNGFDFDRFLVYNKYG